MVTLAGLALAAVLAVTFMLFMLRCARRRIMWRAICAVPDEEICWRQLVGARGEQNTLAVHRYFPTGTTPR